MKNIILAFSTIFIFSQCAKKTAETVQPVDKSWRKTAPAPAPWRVRRSTRGSGVSPGRRRPSGRGARRRAVLR